MLITPIEIRQKSFEKSFRGYNVDEVDAFLYSLAFVWEKLTFECNALKLSLESNQKEVNRLRAVENALLKNVQDAETTANNIIKQTEKAAALKIREAAMEAKEIIQQAESKAKAIEEESKANHQQLTNQLNAELQKIEKTIQQQEDYRDELIRQFQQIAKDILQKIRHTKNIHQHNTNGKAHQKNLQEASVKQDKPYIHVP